jgi:hypothetical protein
MKKLFFGSLLLVGFIGVSNADTYTCYRYKNGKPTGGHVKVKANSKYEAEKKAMEKYRKMHDSLFGGFKADYVNCKK